MKRILFLALLLVNSLSAISQNVAHYESFKLGKAGPIQLDLTVKNKLDTFYELKFTNQEFQNIKDASVTKLSFEDVKELYNSLDTFKNAPKGKNQDLTIVLSCGISLGWYKSKFYDDEIMLLDKRSKYTTFGLKSSEKFMNIIEEKVLKQ